MILGSNGRPMQTDHVTEVHIWVVHKPAGAGPPQKIPILAAQVDGTIDTVRQVLAQAVGKLLQALLKLGAINKNPDPIKN